MQETYKLLAGIVQASQEERTLEELACLYVEEQDPSILAEAFIKVYDFIFSISGRYFGLTEQDIASLSLERLDFCLQTYEEGHAFLTYFGTVLKNKFREETQALNCQKRKAIFHSTSYDVLVDNGFDLVAAAGEENDLIEELREYGLTDRELEYCVYLLIGHPNAIIAEMMGCSIMTLSNMRKKLRNKLGTFSELALGF